jgi:hypothetical protein
MLECGSDHVRRHGFNSDHMIGGRIASVAWAGKVCNKMQPVPDRRVEALLIERRLGIFPLATSLSRSALTVRWGQDRESSLGFDWP